MQLFEQTQTAAAPPVIQPNQDVAYEPTAYRDDPRYRRPDDGQPGGGAYGHDDLDVPGHGYSNGNGSGYGNGNGSGNGSGYSNGYGSDEDRRSGIERIYSDDDL
jgi:hypothetical protein